MVFASALKYLLLLPGPLITKFTYLCHLQLKEEMSQKNFWLVVTILLVMGKINHGAPSG